MLSAPAAIMCLSSTPWLKRVPRIRKLSAGHSPRSFWPQASRSHSRFDSKPPAAKHAALGRDAFAGLGAHGHEALAVELDRGHGRVVADLHAEPFGAAEIGIDQRLAAAHEEGIGARHVQCARQRRLEVHAVAAHPVAAVRRGADHQPREVLVGEAARHLQQVLPVLLFRVGIDQHVLRRVVHAAQVAGVLRIAAAPFFGRGLQQQHRSAGFARHQGGAQRGIAAADNQYVYHSWVSLESRRL